MWNGQLFDGDSWERLDIKYDSITKTTSRQFLNWLQSRSYACLRCETPHRLQLKLRSAIISTSLFVCLSRGAPPPPRDFFFDVMHFLGIFFWETDPPPPPPRKVRTPYEIPEFVTDVLLITVM